MNHFLTAKWGTCKRVVGDDAGTMILTPPPEDAMEKIKKRDFPFTSRRVCNLETSCYMSQQESKEIADHIVEMHNSSLPAEPAKPIQTVYIRFKPLKKGQVKTTKELIAGTILADYDKSGELVGIEVLSPIDVKIERER